MESPQTVVGPEELGAISEEAAGSRDDAGALEDASPAEDTCWDDACALDAVLNAEVALEERGSREVADDAPAPPEDDVDDVADVLPPLPLLHERKQNRPWPTAGHASLPNAGC